MTLVTPRCGFEQWTGASAGLTRTLLTTKSGTTTSSFTPPNNSLLVVCVGAQDIGGSDPSSSISVSGGSLTWTKQVAKVYNSAEAPSWLIAAIFTAPVVTGAPMTVSYSSPTPWVTGLTVLGYTGTNASPIGTTGSATFSEEVTGVLSYNLAVAPALKSEVLAQWTHTNLGGPFTDAPLDMLGSGWTELYYNSACVSTSGRRSNSTSRAVASANMTVQYGGVSSAALEIKSA